MLAERAELTVKSTAPRLGVSGSGFYSWLARRRGCVAGSAIFHSDEGPGTRRGCLPNGPTTTA